MFTNGLENPVTVPAFDDWMELLGLESEMSRLLTGQISATAAEDAVQAARETYPNVSQDYVALLDLALDAIGEVRKAIEIQQRAVLQFNRSAEEFQLEVPYEPGRLMTEDEENTFNERGEQLQVRLDQAEAGLKRQQRDADQAQREEEVRADQAEVEVEQALKEYEDALEDFEDAESDYEDLLDETAERRL